MKKWKIFIKNPLYVDKVWLLCVCVYIYIVFPISPFLWQQQQKNPLKNCVHMQEKLLMLKQKSMEHLVPLASLCFSLCSKPCRATFGVSAVKPLREELIGVWGLLMHALAPSGLHNSHCQLKSQCWAPTLSCLSSSHTVKSLSEQMKPPAQHCRGTLSRNSHSPAPTGLTKSRSCHETLASDQGSPVSKPQERHFAMN